MDVRPSTAFVGIVAAIVVAAALQSILIVRSGTVSADSIIFISIARDLPQAPLETLRKQDQHPGFAVAVLATTRAVQWLGYRAEPESWMIGGRIVTFACGLLSVWVVWLLARDLYDVRIANLAAMAFAVLPVPRANAADAQSDTAHLFFYLLATWLVMTALAGGRPLRLVGAGLASGIAYWIRPEGLEVALVGLACVIGYAVYAHWGWRRVGLSDAALAGTALVVAAPYCVLAGKFTSKQIPFAKYQPTGTFIAQVADEEANAKQKPATAAPTPPAVVERHYSLSLFLRLTGKAVTVYFYSICQGFKFVFIPLYLIGMAAMVRNCQSWPPIVFLSLLGVLHTVVLLGVFVLSGYIAHRHVLPLVGLAMPFAALGTVSLGNWLSRRTGVCPTYAITTVMGLSAAFVLASTLKPFNREFLPVIEATRWVEAHAEPGAGIVCNSPYVGFYGTRPTAILGPQAPTLDEAVAKAEVAARYDYVILHVGAHAYRPEWLSQILERYRPIQELPDPYCLPKKPRKVVIFEANQLEARRAQSGPNS